jgi:hypothetical protein
MAVRQPWQDNYQPQTGENGDGYAGDLNKGNEKEYEEHDARVDATRAEFGRTPASKDVPGA